MTLPYLTPAELEDYLNSQGYSLRKDLLDDHPYHLVFEPDSGITGEKLYIKVKEVYFPTTICVLLECNNIPIPESMENVYRQIKQLKRGSNK